MQIGLDNHLILTAPADDIPAGTTYEVDLTLLLTHTSSIDEDIEDIGQQALETGVLQ